MTPPNLSQIRDLEAKEYSLAYTKKYMKYDFEKQVNKDAFKACNFNSFQAGWDTCEKYARTHNCLVTSEDFNSCLLVF